MEYNGANTILALYVHGQGAGDDPLVRYSGNSVAITNARFLYTDRLGSVIYETDRYGANARYWAYDDYGAADLGSGARAFLPPRLRASACANTTLPPDPGSGPG